MALASFTLIVSVDSKNGMSKNGVLRWDATADQRFFKDLTVKRKETNQPQNVLIMGRKTYESIPPQ